ncbi:MAG: molybdenum cofactor biosynthesis protein MoaE [Rhodospirillales bacterium]|nr:molybdenum cofactor biosynthesis protein MoaE [Rhodospirillales bacterium]MDH3791003.1 molybdenum cofactor biosynthesis protein MoaE [Rhodospirillales bacterium]MDH3909725.1 molybdenum cofactor biosynthesis protein MoaE [Rhodospirillales bacterium]MDH3916733.1 molybdenum cofactor biosynthesis protein MoaE [Rhodospirillales bacterium]MDH3966054.1 molybdenum cofactor biosynthesis protein MoaE [Rhodospirillales bacterium]
MIRVQREDFDPGRELAALTAGNHKVGGLAVFVGLVRDMAGDETVGAMTLEHYPGMTEKMLERIEAEARARWPLEACLVIHRTGRLEPGERIVLVACASAHRQAAFEACGFLIDWLKTKAPFWKLEEGPAGAKWVEARESDDEAAARWAPEEPDAAE